MKVALYVRVSRDDLNADNQLLALRAWASQNSHVIIHEYIDHASGSRRREHLDDLFDDAKKHKFELVAFWSMDRLTREGVLPTLMYIHRLNALGVKTFSFEQPYLNPSLPFYESFVALFADMAKWEREWCRKRTLQGLERARSQGKHLGRPKGTKDSKKRHRRNKETMAVVKRYR